MELKEESQMIDKTETPNGLINCILNNNDWEDINHEAGIDIMDIVINLDGKYSLSQQADLIVERCNLAARAQLEKCKTWVEEQIKVEMDKTNEALELAKNISIIAERRGCFGYSLEDIKEKEKN